MDLCSRAAVKSGGRPVVAVYSHSDLIICQDTMFSLSSCYFITRDTKKTESGNIHPCSSVQCSHQHQSCFPASNTPRTTDVYMVVTTRLNVNKLATTLLLLPCVWGADSASHFIHKELAKSKYLQK